MNPAEVPPFNAYMRHPSPPAMGFSHRWISGRNLDDPALVEHLQAFGEYVSVGQTAESELSTHIRLVQHQISFHTDDLDGLTEWAMSAVAVVFWPDGTVRDPQHRVLFSPDQSVTDPEAALPWYPDSIERKRLSIERLIELGISHLASLPLLPSEHEVPLPPVSAVVDRVTSLLAVAVRGESAGQGEPIPMEQLRGVLPRALDGLTPEESRWLSNDDPDEQSIANFTWRYECVPVLLWALQLLPTLDLPAAICDVPRITRLVLDTDWSTVEATAELRSPAEVLDQTDLYYRIHWAMVNSRLGSTPPVEGLEPGAVYERRYALEWLIAYPEPWDDVAMNT